MIVGSQLQVGFVNEGGRVHRVVALPSPTLSVRQPLQLFVDERKELIESGIVSRSDCSEENGDCTLPLVVHAAPAMKRSCGLQCE
jgi:hypothetical protein